MTQTHNTAPMVTPQQYILFHQGNVPCVLERTSTASQLGSLVFSCLRMIYFLFRQQGIDGLETANRKRRAFFGALGTGTAQMRAGAISLRRGHIRGSRLVFGRRGGLRRSRWVFSTILNTF